MLVNQAGAGPTNKLTAAIVGSFAWILSKTLVAHFLHADFADPVLWDAALPIYLWGAGYFIKDQANVATPLVVKAPEDAK